MGMSIVVNGFQVETTNFPNGEVGFETIRGEVNVRWKYDGDHELVHLKMLADHYGSNSNLIIDYLPYSRMDRVKGNWVFTLKTVCNLINSMGFAHVWVAEPHSDVCMGMLDNATPWYPTHQGFWQVEREIGFDRNKDYLIYPDAGAEKRYADMYKGFKTMTGFKKRDFQTGKITSFNMVDSLADGPMDTIGRKAIIVDDLCSYGGTFLATAERLVTSYGIEDITLLVAHLETAVYKGKLLQLDSPIKTIYTTDSIHRIHPELDFLTSSKIKIYQSHWPREAVTT